MTATVKALVKRLILWARTRGLGVRIGRGCRIAIGAKFEGRNVVHDGTAFEGELGLASYIGRDCQISGRIGRFCSISSEVVVIRGRHPTREFVSTHPAFYSLAKQAGFTYARTQLFEENEWADVANSHAIVVGHDVLLSHGVRILEGVTIGDGAVVAAGSLVRTDVEPYAIYAGVPARKVGQRFDDETIAKLLVACWWDRPESWIAEHAELFADVEEFLKKKADG